MTDLSKFTEACIEALYFTDAGPGDECQGAELSEETRLDLEADCRSFWRRFGAFVNAAECTRGSGQYSNAEQAGHDFWLSRNGHGAGFWDGDWPDSYSGSLSKGSEAYGNFEIYLGDDGKIYA